MLGAVSVAAALAVAGCSSSPEASPSSGDAVLQTFGLSGLAAREVIDQLDRLPVAERDQRLRASVRPGELQVTDTRSGAATSLDLPDDVFYVSIAPYVEQTHECFYHSLTTCKGELGGEPVHVTITDKATGAALFDDDTTTYDNGFVGFWLPAGIEATLTVEHAGRSATADIATGPEDPTCLTTLQLV